MQVLYVVDFDLNMTNEPDASQVIPPINKSTVALQCIVDWINRSSTTELSSSDLHTDGSITLTSTRPHHTRSAHWQSVSTDTCFALRLEVSDKNNETGGEFITRLTLGTFQNRQAFRVSMARTFPTDWLSPVPPADLRQPGVIHNFLTNEQISLRVRKQRQDGKYIQIRSTAEVETLVDALESDERLPILIVHTRTLPALKAAREAANKLVGLTSVVTVDYSALRQLERKLPNSSPPYAGARLIWSDISAPTVEFDTRDVNDTNPDLLRARLMDKLAPISVTSRGVDHIYQRARQEQSAARSDDAKARVEAAAATGDLSVQLKMLEERNQELQIEVKDWQDLAFDAEQEVSQMRERAERAAALEEQVNQLNIALRASVSNQADEGEKEADPWNSMPTLESGSKESAQHLYLRLQEITSERTVFTDRALTSWKKANYPYPDEMREALIKLSRVSTVLYDGSDRTIPHLDQWIREEFDLKVALQDDTIQKNKGLRKFHYENQEHDRTPHVKVRDNAPHQEVGRIHFALDTKNSRIIVDHVGIKLY